MNNSLATIVKESGLEISKAKYILDNFQNYFEIADEWSKKAKALVVTDESQMAEMQMARVGRLFLREKRIAIEKSRKELKEQALREGKAIDGIANVLKALIVPIEEHLGKQERFIEIRAEQKIEAARIEAERKAEEERIAKEKADAEEQERIRVENVKLKAEAIARERKAEKERKKQEKILAEERARTEKEKKELEDKQREMVKQAQIERVKQAKLLADQAAKARAEREKQDRLYEKQQKAAEDKACKERVQAEARAAEERKEKERLAEILKNQVECPKCHHKFQLER